MSPVPSGGQHSLVNSARLAAASDPHIHPAVQSTPSGFSISFTSGASRPPPPPQGQLDVQFAASPDQPSILSGDGQSSFLRPISPLTDAVAALRQNDPAAAGERAIPLKRTRSTKACDMCRKKRTKCSGVQPCEGCLSFGFACTYNTPQKKRGPPKRVLAKSTTTINDRLKTVESILNNLITPGSSELVEYSKGHSESDEEYWNDHEDEDEHEDSESKALVTKRLKIGTGAQDEEPSEWDNVDGHIGGGSSSPSSSSSKGVTRVHRLENEAGTIALLENVDAGILTFFGRTSTATSKFWKQSPRFNEGVMTISLSFQSRPPEAEAETFPCSPALVDFLVKQYFDHTHTYFPMVDKQTFMEDYKSDQHPDHFLCLLYAICLIMAQQYITLKEWGIDSISDLRKQFFSRVHHLIGKCFDMQHINILHAELIMCMVGWGPTVIVSSYLYAGMAHRMAVELGMHRNLDTVKHPRFDSRTRETFRITWCCLYVIDRYSSLITGRPLAINDDEWDTPLPAEAEGTPELIFHVGLCKILGRITSYLNKPLSKRNSRKRDAEITADLLAQLKRWHERLPARLKSEPAGLWSIQHHLHAAYHTTNILVRRMTAGHFDSSCVKSGQAIVGLFRALPINRISNVNKDGQAQTSYRFVHPIIVYFNLTTATLFLDLLLASIPTKGNKLAPIACDKVPGAEELKTTLDNFVKLREYAMFSIYYRHLIIECIREHGVHLDGITDNPNSLTAPKKDDSGDADPVAGDDSERGKSKPQTKSTDRHSSPEVVGASRIYEYFSGSEASPGIPSPHTESLRARTPASEGASYGGVRGQPAPAASPISSPGHSQTLAPQIQPTLQQAKPPLPPKQSQKQHRQQQQQQQQQQQLPTTQPVQPFGPSIPQGSAFLPQAAGFPAAPIQLMSAPDSYPVSNAATTMSDSAQIYYPVSAPETVTFSTGSNSAFQPNLVSNPYMMSQMDEAMLSGTTAGPSAGFLASVVGMSPNMMHIDDKGDGVSGAQGMPYYTGSVFSELLNPFIPSAAQTESMSSPSSASTSSLPQTFQSL
ncbi:fungal-specific transcription factor domain-containing protein [Polychytrium aggregatum]|uniref:fungal-specific transcription factor domain-containing protein n=1 Tax=Polychytrium aggregatum TaxID=110093 RepID=UPI0022FDDC9F|nr:fungal-specific transcription factor domain-containing protein [Polychytrium aggregatum]KAI9203699.1 fungal-specific transcription factor domain-containing protein [Polychytrium aggregatum]